MQVGGQSNMMMSAFPKGMLILHSLIGFFTYLHRTKGNMERLELPYI